MEICSQKTTTNYRTTSMDYQKPGTFSTPLCLPYEQKKFYDSDNPSKDDVRNMCRLNNGCKSNDGYTYLNERGVEQSPFFKSGKSSLNMPVEQSKVNDARLNDTTRNYIQELDIKPIQVYYNLINDNISHNPELKNYGKNYKGYSTVTGGQIQYYIDNQQTEPFDRPIYGATTKAVGYMFKDPMDAVKPQFEKEYANNSFTSLSWLDDSTAHRDDIIALQQRKHNEQKYELVYNRL
uniref:Uncharacterized protein n=1 Tax=viral metagenome TaxID=1070528 RepID=A0A6C0KSA1_9ZZZZ